MTPVAADAPAGAVGQAISTVNVEGLSVDTGNWRAEGVQSQYGFVEIIHLSLCHAVLDTLMRMNTPGVEPAFA